MSSKKKKRLESFLAREAKRKELKEVVKKYNEAWDIGDIEKMAKAMNIKLK